MTGVLSGTPTAVGTFNFTITATNANGTDADAYSVTINQATQTITFNNPGATNFSTTPIASGASASSMLPVTLTSTTPAVCTITPANSLNITMVTAGTCTINANQAGNANFAAAPQVQQTFTINATAPGAPTLNTGTSGDTQATFAFTANANNGGSPVTGFTATCNPGGITATNANSPIVMMGLANGTTYTCSVTATNAAGTSAASNTVMVQPTATPVPPTITSPNSFGGFTVNVAGTTFTVTATGTPSVFTFGVTGTLPTGLSFAPATGVLSGTPTQAGTFPLTFTAANGTLPNASQSFTLTVAAAAQTITFVGPGAQVFSTTPVAISATASSMLTVTFTSATPAVCSVTGTNVTMITVGTCTINANQAGNANFAAAPQVQQSFMITQAPQTITFPAQPARTFSASPQGITPAATASSGLAVTYSSTTPAVCTVSGATFTSVSVGTCTIAANQAGNANFSAAPQVTQSFMITQGSQTISFGFIGNQSLGTGPFTVSATSTSGLAVTVTSTTPAVCTSSGVNGTTITILTLGVCTLQGTQAGNANFAAATPVTTSFNVVPPGAVMLTTNVPLANYRQPVTVTADVGGTNPTGVVTFSLSTPTGLVTLCSNVPLANARASCPVPGNIITTNPVNFHAQYSGDGVNSANSAVVGQAVQMNGVTLTAVTVPIQQPVAGGSVTLRATVAGRNLTNTVAFNENGSALPGCGNVAVALLPGANDIGVATCAVNNIAAGTHSYVITYRHTADAGFEQIVLPVTAVSSGPADATNMFWKADENGWGASITQHGRAQFIVLYVYDNAGNPIWYVMPDGTWNANNTTFTGLLYQPTSSPFSTYSATLFNPLGNAGGPVGTLSVTYTSATAATLNFTINGTQGSKAIVRQDFGADDGQPRLQVADMWWGGAVDPTQNGWGMNIAQQGRVLFPVWYTYDGQGRTVFYAVPGGTWNGSTFTGDIYTTVSSRWLGVNYNPAQFQVTKVGTMTLDFSDQSTAVMTYTIGGTTQRKNITRQAFP